MVREGAGHGQLAANCCDSAIEFLRIGYAGKSQNPRTCHLGMRARRERCHLHRLSGACRAAHQLIGGIAAANLQERRHLADLFRQRRTQRPARHQVTVADGAHRIHHNKGEVQFQPGALEPVIHDDEIATLCHQPFCTIETTPRNHRHRLASQKKRFVAHRFGTMMMRINQRRDIQRTAITTAEKAGDEPFALRSLGDGNGGRCLSGPTDGKVTDAKDRNGNTWRTRFGHTPPGNPAIEIGDRPEAPGPPIRLAPPERRRFRNHLSSPCRPTCSGGRPLT